MLPTGTVTLLLADIEGSTGLWESRPDEMAAAVAALDRILVEVERTHNGVRPVEQGEGDSFVIAFVRASDAVACALDLQRAPLSPIRLRIGLHTGEVQLRDERNYYGPTINKTGRLRDLAHGGQTVMSGATEELVADWLPPQAWLTDLGTHTLRGVARSERIMQLCHPDIENEFPPLRTGKTAVAQNLPLQLTSFIGRGEEIKDACQLLMDNRLITLTGAGGVGKTRLALQIATLMAAEFEDGARFVDLGPLSDPENVAVATARALGLPDPRDRSTIETITRFIGDHRTLIVLDNCEHLLDACAELVNALLGACPGLTLLATSREPLAVPGEVTWRVPSLSLSDEAVALFADRARRARPDFEITEENTAEVLDICERLDGMPLAIELAAARVRALSVTEISAGLHNRFRLLTGGARTLMPRQQTLRASVDWSHALLTDAERILFRRLAVFVGGFDLTAAHAVAADDGVDRFQVLDRLTMLVDKSLVIAEDSHGRTRYRLLETVRQYAADQLEESGEAREIRMRHRDHYTAVMDVMSTHQQIELVGLEVENLRSALAFRADDEPDPDLLIRGSRSAAWLLDYPLADRLADAAIGAGAGTEASHLRAYVLMTLGRGREAETLLANLDDSATTMDRANTVFYRAVNRLFVLSDPTGAMKFVDDAVQHIPDSARSPLDAFRTVYWAAMGKPEATLTASQNVDWDQLSDVAARMTWWAMTVAYGDSGRTDEATAAAETGYFVPARPWFLNISDAHVAALLHAGLTGDAGQVAERLSRRAVGFPNSQLTQISTALEGRAALAAGRLVSACFLLGQASERMAASGDTHGWGYRVELSRTTALAMRGLTDKARDSLSRLQSLRHPSWRYLDYEWQIAHGWVSACLGAVDDAIAMSLSGADTAHHNGQLAAEVMCLQTATQFGDRSTVDRLGELAGLVSGPRAGLAARFASALNAGDGAQLSQVSEQFERIGDIVAAVDAAAHAATAYAVDGKREPRSASASRAQSLAQAGSISTPALARIPG